MTQKLIPELILRPNRNTIILLPSSQGVATYCHLGDLPHVLSARSGIRKYSISSERSGGGALSGQQAEVFDAFRRHRMGF